MKANLYDWVFNFNHYKGIWRAVRREDYNILFDNDTSEKVLRSSDINTLIDIIIRTNGDKDKLKKLITIDESY